MSCSILKTVVCSVGLRVCCCEIGIVLSIKTSSINGSQTIN